MAGGVQTSASRMQGEPVVPVRMFVANALLIGLVVISAFGTIFSTHACRALYTSLQVLESSQWHLQEDYGRLLLEQSTQASHYRVEKIARSDLEMVAPDLSRFKVVSK